MTVIKIMVMEWFKIFTWDGSLPWNTLNSNTILYLVLEHPSWGSREKLTKADFDDFLPLTKFRAKTEEYLVDFKKQATVLMILMIFNWQSFNT